MAGSAELARGISHYKIATIGHLSGTYIFQKLIMEFMEKEHQQLHVKYNSPMSNINDFELFRRHKNLEHVQHDQRVGRVSQTAKIERPRDPSIESSSSVDTGGTRSSATLTCNCTVWTINHVLVLAEFLTTSSHEKEL